MLRGMIQRNYPWERVECDTETVSPIAPERNDRHAWVRGDFSGIIHRVRVAQVMLMVGFPSNPLSRIPQDIHQFPFSRLVLAFHFSLC
jgi:hypothetical protein